ncbi:MAG: glucosaminidase domain-containing protein [Halioglobus sp.]
MNNFGLIFTLCIKRSLLSLVLVVAPLVNAQEVIVLSGYDEVSGWMKNENWWGEEKRSQQLQVPHVLITGIPAGWRENSKKIIVADKKEIFYRTILPLVMHANEMVLDRRERMQKISFELESGNAMTVEELDFMREVALLLRIVDKERAAFLQATDPAWLGIIETALYHLDIIPAGLVLGQAAYESGYGTSRFAAEGNALFGQWTYGGKGLVPEQQRKDLGDHRIASFDWPFDSVRGYYINLSSHPAYEDFRRLRAELRATGKPLNSMILADGLIAYSERGQKYVDTLKGIMRVNNLTIADDAVFRDEPVRFLMGAESPEKATELKAEIERMRGSGELTEIIARMRLE